MTHPTQFTCVFTKICKPPLYNEQNGLALSFKFLRLQLISRRTSGNSNNNNSTFSIRITNDARDSLAFSWTRTITIRLYNVPKQDNSKMETEDLKVSLLQGMRVKINGKRVTLPYIRMGVLSAMKDGYKIVLRTADGK